MATWPGGACTRASQSCGGGNRSRLEPPLVRDMRMGVKRHVCDGQGAANEECSPLTMAFHDLQCPVAADALRLIFRPAAVRQAGVFLEEASYRNAGLVAVVLEKLPRQRLDARETTAG